MVINESSRQNCESKLRRLEKRQVSLRLRQASEFQRILRKVDRVRNATGVNEFAGYGEVARLRAS